MGEHAKKPWHRHHIQDLPYQLDFYMDTTLTLSEWIRKGEGDALSKDRAAVDAVLEVQERNYHVPGESPDIRVAYDYVTDAPFFIFRYRSNGRSLIVSSIRLAN